MSDRRYYRTLDAWGTSDAPPMAFRLFAIGANDATHFGGPKKTVYLTAAWSTAIAAEWERRGIDGAIDFEHASVSSDGREGVPAAGWFRLEARNDGLWATILRWSDRALEYFARKEYRYFSQVFDVTRGKDGREYVCAFLNFCLTNWPASDNQRPLIALSQRRSHSMLSPTQATSKAQELADKYGIDAARISELALDLMALDSAEEAPEIPMEGAPAPTDAPIAEDAIIAQTAREVTGQVGRDAVVGALKAFSSARTQATDQAARLAQLERREHERNVEAAIAAKKLAPAQRAWAMTQSPEALSGYLAVAVPLVDDRSLSADSKSAAAVVVTVEQLEADPKLVAYCAKTKTNVKLYAQQWATKFPNKPFKAQ